MNPEKKFLPTRIKRLIFLSALIYGALAWSQPVTPPGAPPPIPPGAPPHAPNDPTYAFERLLTQDGRLVSVTVVPKNVNTEIFVAGKKEADLNVKNAQVHAKIIKPQPERNLRVTQQGDHYIIEESLPRAPMELQVQAGNDTDSEIFNFDIDGRTKPRGTTSSGQNQK